MYDSMSPVYLAKLIAFSLHFLSSFEIKFLVKKA